MWTWFEGAGLEIKRREAERHMMVAAAIPTDHVALSVGQYRALQVVQFATATKRDAQAIIQNDEQIEGVPLSKHSRATLAAAVSRAYLRLADDKPDPGPTVREDRKEAPRRARSWKAWATREGAHPMVDVRERDGQLYVRIESLANELDLIMDDDD